MSQAKLREEARALKEQLSAGSTASADANAPNLGEDKPGKLDEIPKSSAAQEELMWDVLWQMAQVKQQNEAEASVW